MDSQYVVVNGNVLTIDTSEDIERVKRIMCAEGVLEAEIWVGDPDSSDTYKTGQRLFAH